MDGRQLLHGEVWHGRHANWNAIGALVEQLEAVHLPPDPQDVVWYGWEPAPLLDFLEGMTAAADFREADGATAPGRFLDVGSGIGSKLVVAAALGWSADGIERYEPYARVSVDLFPKHPVTVVNAMNYRGYDLYDLVYCDRLGRQDSAQEQLLAHVTRHMRPGALLFAFGPPYPDWLDHVSGYVWQV